MAARDRSLRAQRKALVSAMLVFSVLLVLLQLWLLTATVNAVLDGDASMALPAACVSAACLALNLGLLRYLIRFE